MSEISNATRVAPQNLLKAYKLGRALNRLNWNAQIAYLCGDAAAAKCVSRLLGRLAVDVRAIVEPGTRDVLTQMVNDQRTQWCAELNSPSQSEDLCRFAEAADQVPEQGDPATFRWGLCKEVLSAISSLTPALSDAVPAGADRVMKKALALGMRVDQGLRPAPAYRYILKQPVPTPTPAITSFSMIATPAPRIVAAKDFLAPRAVGSIPLGDNWLSMIQQLWFELTEELDATGTRLSTGSAWVKLPLRSKVYKVNQFIMQAIKSLQNSPATAVTPGPAAAPTTATHGTTAGHEGADDYLTVEQVCQMYAKWGTPPRVGSSRKTILRKLRAKTLRGKFLLGVWRIKKADAITYWGALKIPPPKDSDDELEPAGAEGPPISQNDEYNKCHKKKLARGNLK